MQKWSNMELYIVDDSLWVVWWYMFRSWQTKRSYTSNTSTLSITFTSNMEHKLSHNFPEVSLVYSTTQYLGKGHTGPRDGQGTQSLLRKIHCPCVPRAQFELLAKGWARKACQLKGFAGASWKNADYVTIYIYTVYIYNLSICIIIIYYRYIYTHVHIIIYM